MTIYTETQWPTVRQHPWKYRYRTRTITGILWHTTRGNQGYDGATEIGAYRNWVLSPNNRNPGAIRNGIEPYAGIASVGIGPGVIMECVPDILVPAWSSWPSDETKLSVEVAQSNLGQPIDPETIASCVKYARAMANKYDFPLTRVFPTDDDTWTGLAGHEDTLQGKASGKSDPGEAFWVPFMAALNEEESLAAEDIARIDRLEKLLAANGIAKDPAAYAASGYDPALLTFGEEALRWASERGWSAFLGIGLGQVADHEQTQSTRKAGDARMNVMDVSTQVYCGNCKAIRSLYWVPMEPNKNNDHPAVDLLCGDCHFVIATFHGQPL